MDVSYPQLRQESKDVSANREVESFLDRLRSLHAMARSGVKKPHKYLFILTLLRLYRNNPQRTPQFPLDKTLIDAFSAITSEILPNLEPRSIFIEYPFFHLTSDGFWSLNIFPGKEETFRQYAESSNMRLTQRRLSETVQSGYLNDSVHALFRDLSANAQIERFLLEELRHFVETLKAHASDVGPEVEKSRSLFAHETAALDSISQHVKSHGLGVPLQNLELHDPQSNRYFEVDLVVVSQFGVYVVVTKFPRH
jgi:predicted restriction endonuclease